MAKLYVSQNQFGFGSAIASLVIMVPLLALLLTQSAHRFQDALLDRNDTVGSGISRDFHQYLKPLSESLSQPACNPDNLRRLRQTDFRSKYLSYYAEVRDGHILCTSYEGKLANPVALPAEYVQFDAETAILNDLNTEVIQTQGTAAIRAGNLIAVFDYPELSNTISKSWLDYASYSLINNQFTSVKPFYTHPLNDINISGNSKRWFEGGYYIASRCSIQNSCDLVSIDIVNYVKSQKLTLTVLLMLTAMVMWAFYRAGCHLHSNIFSLPNQLRAGLKNNELTLHYQPIVSTTSSEVIGCEVLCRWHAADGHSVSPDTFIPMVEDNGLCEALTESVTRTAIKELKLHGLLGKVRVAINTFPEDIESGFMKRNLNRHVPERYLPWFTVEITEKSVGNLDNLAKNVDQLRALGVQVSVDDFGTGFSNLETLQAIKVDQIKIDRSFIIGVEKPSLKRSIVDNICQLAESLNVRIVAEGIETAQQLEFVKTRNIALTQGYFHSKPLAIADFAQFVSNHTQNDKAVA